MPPRLSPFAARLLARLAAVLVVGVGLAVLVAGLQRTTAFGGDRALIGRLPRVSQPVVVTAPGMTDLAGATVRVRAASDDRAEPVFIGVGRADDVEAYLGAVRRIEITALEETGVLRIAARDGEATLPDPSGVDVWASSVRAAGVASLTWPRTPGPWRVVIATDGATPPSAAEFTWSGTPGASPAPALIAVGSVLLVVGLAALLAMRSGRLFAAAQRAEERSERLTRAARPPGPRSQPSAAREPAVPEPSGSRPADGSPPAEPEGPAPEAAGAVAPDAAPDVARQTTAVVATDEPATRRGRRAAAAAGERRARPGRPDDDGQAADGRGHEGRGLDGGGADVDDDLDEDAQPAVRPFRRTSSTGDGR